MTTAVDIIKRSLNQLGVSSLVSPPDPNDILECFALLKQMLAMWEQESIALGITIPTVVGDDLAEPDWATLAIEANLAVLYAPQAQVQARQDLTRIARSQKMFLQARVAPTPTQIYPDSLPLGQGNKQWPGRRRFYPQDETITGENGVNIISEGS